MSQHEPASVDGRPASAANWGEFGSIYGTALASPHRSGPSKLPGHVSLKRFETAKLPGHVSFASLACYGLLASLQPSKLPGHVSLRGFETATWHVLARLEKP